LVKLYRERDRQIEKGVTVGEIIQRERQTDRERSYCW
jgi:hypothetical protein